MDSMIDLDDIETRLIFCITYYIHVNRPPPANTKFNPEHLEKVNQKKFVKEKYNSAFRRVAEHIKRIIPKADIYANHEKASQVGEFTVYSYGLGNPDKDIFFTNVDRKQAFPSLSTLYYIIIGILINYDDFGLLQRKQEQYIQGKFHSFLIFPKKWESISPLAGNTVKIMTTNRGFRRNFGELNQIINNPFHIFLD